MNARSLTPIWAITLVITVSGLSWMSFTNKKVSKADIASTSTGVSECIALDTTWNCK